MRVRLRFWLCLTLFLSLSVLTVAAVPKLVVYYPPYPALEFKPDYIPRTDKDTITVEGQTDSDCLVWVGEKPADVFPDGTFRAVVSLEEGENIICIKAQSSKTGEAVILQRRIIRDTVPPLLEIFEPKDGAFVNTGRVTVSGKTEPKSRLFINGAVHPLLEDGSFRTEVSLTEGENFIYVAVFDEKLPNMEMQVIQVNLDTVAPFLDIEFPDIDYIATEDYITVRGSTEPFATVAVTQHERKVQADKDGKFSLRLPLDEGRNYFYFDVQDLAGNEISERVRIEKDTTKPQVREYKPTGILAYSPGDILNLTLTASEARCEVTFSIGDKGPFPMTEVTSGNYSGVYRFQSDDIGEDMYIEVTLTDKAKNTTTRRLTRVTVYDPARPVVAQILAPNNPVSLYSGPSTEYDRVGMIKTIAKVEVTARVGDYYRVSPAKTYAAWIHQSNLRFLEEGTAPSKPVISNITASKEGDWTNVTFTMSEPAFYTITPLVHEPALLVTFYNTTSGLYHMAWRKDADFVKLITPMQITDDILQYRIDLKGNTIYGYDVSVVGNNLNLRIKSKFTPFLEGKRITIDPGHGPDSGAVGPTGLLERDLNLEIALKLKELLEDAGCRVYLTRDKDYNYAPELSDRVAFAERYQTDLFVSIHNNAASNRSASGTESYYYTPYSHELARLSIKYMNEHQGSEYRFFAHRSFAVIRQWTMPAILTEGDFVSNYSIEVWQKSGDFSTKNAEAIFMAIKEFVETFGFLD